MRSAGLGAGAPVRRVVLVGFMGAGKTTVGKLVAERLGWTCVDLDALIEQRARAGVARIFAERGERAFREEERRAARALAECWECVVATGGGAWPQPEVRAALMSPAPAGVPPGRAVSVWLDADLETLLARLPEDGTRPLACNRETMRALLAARRPAYELADLRIDAAPPPALVSGAILEALARARDVGRAAPAAGEER